MTEVEFESVTLADAIKKANTVAPTKGKELDMYRGFVFEVNKEEGTVRIRCTNGDLFYSELMYPIKIEGKSTTWRVSSRTAFGVASNLPLKAGKKVVLKEAVDPKLGKVLLFTYGSMKATMPFIDHSSYPDWDDFDDSDLPIIEGFGSSIDQISWAVDTNGMPPKGGIFMDESCMIATNGYLLAYVPIAMEMPENRENIVAPVKALTSILRQFDEVKVGIRGGQLLIAPTDSVHVICFLWDDAFPNVTRILSQSYEEVLMLDKEYTVEVLNRVKSIGVDDRQVSMSVDVGKGEIVFGIKDEQSTETISESIDLPGMAAHDVAHYEFSADYFLNAVQKAPGKQVTWNYNPALPTTFTKFEGSDGYEVTVIPRTPLNQKKAK